MALKYNPFTDNFDLVEPESAFPKYFIGEDVNITVGSYGQYVIHDVGYLDIEGIIDLEEGAMIIIE